MTTDPQPEQALIDIAVLDDDRDFLNYIEDLLSDEGQYAVRVFQRAEALFEAAEQRRPDIVLLDMKMGRTRGDEVLERLMTRWPELCVIIVTGYPSLEDMRATFRKNVFDYLAKPFTLNQLRQALSNAAERYGLGRALTDRLREKLGQRIRVLRAERGWSLKDLAAATRLSVSQISSIERGANLPSMESLLAISRAFGLKPSHILQSIEF